MRPEKNPRVHGGWHVVPQKDGTETRGWAPWQHLGWGGNHPHTPLCPVTRQHRSSSGRRRKKNVPVAPTLQRQQLFNLGSRAGASRERVRVLPGHGWGGSYCLGEPSVQQPGRTRARGAAHVCVSAQIQACTALECACGAALTCAHGDLHTRAAAHTHTTTPPRTPCLHTWGFRSSRWVPRPWTVPPWGGPPPCPLPRASRARALGWTPVGWGHWGQAPPAWLRAWGGGVSSTTQTGFPEVW